jgi:glycosyltransferase involved in cell wall biosynthesis
MASLADPRVRYLHLAERTPLGVKRNMAVEQASGAVIVHFDDDDYYAPAYVETMIAPMRDGGVDFVKLVAFFVYNRLVKQCGYWDLMKRDGPHFAWWNSTETPLIQLPQTEEANNLHLGFGFSYVFRRKVWEAGPFPARGWGEDTPLVWGALGNGFNLHLLNDHTGVCLHVVHGANASRSLPQYILPEWLMLQIFPNLEPAWL